MVPADPLRGLIQSPERLMHPSVPATVSRPPAETERPRQPTSGSNRTAPRSTNTPADPLQGLLVDSDQLLRFSGPKGDPAVTEATSKTEGGALNRVHKSVESTPGIAVPNTSSGSASSYSLPLPALPVSPIAISDGSKLSLGSPDLTGGGPAEKPGANKGTGMQGGNPGPAGEPTPRLVQARYSLLERLEQFVLGTMEQPLSYVLLLGGLGFFVVLRFRRL